MKSKAIICVLTLFCQIIFQQNISTNIALIYKVNGKEVFLKSNDRIRSGGQLFLNIKPKQKSQLFIYKEAEETLQLLDAEVISPENILVKILPYNLDRNKNNYVIVIVSSEKKEVNKLFSKKEISITDWNNFEKTVPNKNSEVISKKAGNRIKIGGQLRTSNNLFEDNNFGYSGSDYIIKKFYLNVQK